ncbi:MAG: STAS domain-containing protein [Myxococcales bacterium]|nr:STAS domain-containing protein [Myxococcales bacterium]
MTSDKRSFELPPDLRHATCAELRQGLLQAIEEATAQAASELEIDARRVRWIDTGGLQLLLSLRCTCQQRGIRLAWRHASDELLRACWRAGASERLGLGEQT